MISKLVSIVLLSSFFGAGLVLSEDTPLGEEMSQVSSSLKKLRRAKDDYTKCLELVREAQVGLLKCFVYVPAKIEKMEEGKEKQVALAGYKKMLAWSYQTLCDLEVAYLSEDIDKIDDAMDLVKKSRGDGHDEYIEEE